MAKTLEVIAEEGGYALHNGSLTEGFVQDIRDNGGIITADDLRNYRYVKIRRKFTELIFFPVKTNMRNIELNCFCCFAK